MNESSSTHLTNYIMRRMSFRIVTEKETAEAAGNVFVIGGRIKRDSSRSAFKETVEVQRAHGRIVRTAERKEDLEASKVNRANGRIVRNDEIKDDSGGSMAVSKETYWMVYSYVWPSMKYHILMRNEYHLISYRLQ